MKTCAVVECGRKTRARELCGKHLQRFYSHGDVTVSKLNREHAGVCGVAECGRPYEANGYCRTHSDRFKAHGSATLADELIAMQNGLCAICQRPPRGRGHEARLHLDHDHSTGRRRAMLCGPCNKAIGLLGDDPALLRAALAYLTAYEEVPA